MAAKDRLIFGIVLVSTYLGVVHSSSIRSENLGSTEPPIMLPYEMSPEHLKIYLKSEAMENVPDYEIVSPLHVKGSRRRRDATSAREKIEYRVTAFGEEFRLILKHNHQLISPGCFIDVHENGNRMTSPCVQTNYNESESDTTSDDDDCFYHGYSSNHNGSVISVALCSGLHGIISVPTSEHDLIIQPISEDHVLRVKRSTAPHNPHLIYRKRRQTSYDVLNDPAIKIKKSMPNASRRKRSTDPLFLELVLVGDNSMYEVHGYQALRDRLLMMANYAASRLVHPSLGTKIILTVTWILMDKGLEVDVKPDLRDNYHTFCKWAINKSDSVNRQFDYIALFTKVDLEYKGKKSVGGFATAGGICSRTGPCSINEDSSLSTSHIVIHEIGHGLGMKHDEDYEFCKYGNFLMGSGVSPNAFKWSRCSGNELKKFLSSNLYSGCLSNEPSVWDAGDEHCTQWLGEGWKYVYESDCDILCTDLKCRKVSADGEIQTSQKSRIIYDGIKCGDNKHCMAGECVSKT